MQSTGAAKSARSTMPDTTDIHQMVGNAVSEVLEQHLPQLRDQIVQRVLEQLPPQRAGVEDANGAGPLQQPAGAENLVKAVASIHAGNTQREILRALLDNGVRYCGRSALFVIKSGAASGWEARGFADNDAIKNFSLDVSSGIAERALQSRMVFSGAASDLDGKFIQTFHAPDDGRVLVLPLVLKDKVAALVYADAGNEGGHLDASAMELLVSATSAWLEVASLRKQAQKEGTADNRERHDAPAAPVQTVSSYSDPFAGTTPRHAAAPAATAQPAIAEPQEASEPAEPGAPPGGSDAISAEDAEVHKKAQRFARLLVDEIKLYNQVKVTEGRKNKDLYDRLKEDIDKSRATYQKRYGNTAAGSAEYFSSEVIRSLAEDDSSVMGPNFRR